MKRQLLITIAALTFLAPGVLLAQSDLTLEELAAQLEGLTSKVTELFNANDDLAQRLAAVETAIAPTSTPTPTATHTPTVVPSPTSPPEQAYLTVQRRMNVRRGPGTHHEILGTAEASAEFDITGKNINEDWWQIDYEGETGWVYAPYVTANHAADIQVVSTPTPIPTPTLRPTNTPSPTPVDEHIECDIGGFEFLDARDVSFGSTIRLVANYSMGSGCDETDALLFAEANMILLHLELSFNAFGFFFYCEPDDILGPNISIDYAPYGDWSRALEVRTGDYSKHEFSLEFAHRLPCE